MFAKSGFLYAFDNFSLLKLNFNNSVIQMRQEKSKKYKIEGVRVRGHNIQVREIHERRMEELTVEVRKEVGKDSE